MLLTLKNRQNSASKNWDMKVHKENYSQSFPTDKLCLIVFCVSTDPHIHEGRQKYRVVCALKNNKKISY